MTGVAPSQDTRTALSRGLVLLMAVRPAINQFRGDTSLLTAGEYNVSILSVWSILYLAFAVARLQRGPAAQRRVVLPISGFLAIVFIFGVPRMLMSEALITDVLGYVQFFVTALTARGVIDDLGIDHVLKRMTQGALVLVLMHATASVWMPERDVIFNDIEGNYLGAFESKHVAARSFFALLPYLVCGVLRQRRSLSAALLPPTLLFLTLALQRVSLLSAAILGLTMVVMARQIKLGAPLLVLVAATILVVPSDRFENFVEEKIQQEVEAYASGDLESVGAGRLGIALLAYTWYADSSVEEQLVGRGTAQAYELHYIVIGHLAYAHMQVVELLIDYGLIGTVLAFLALLRIARAKLLVWPEQHDAHDLVGIGMIAVTIAEMFYAMPLQSGGTLSLFAFWLFTPSAGDVDSVALATKTLDASSHTKPHTAIRHE